MEDPSERSSQNNSSPNRSDQWKKASPVRLLAGGYFKSIQGMVIGSLTGVWTVIIFPRLVPYPEVSGILSTATMFLGLFATIIDWGIWAGLDIILAQAIGSNDHDKIERYVRTATTFKLINGILFNIAIWFIILVVFPQITLDWKKLYSYIVLSNGIRWFGGFAVSSERSIIAAQRFDLETYYMAINFVVLICSRLFWLWIFNSFWFPTNPILACTVAQTVSEACETFSNWTVQALFVTKAGIMPLKRVFRPGWDKEAIRHFFHYGKYVVGRQYLIYISEVNSVLWILLVNYNFPNPEQIIGYWVLAVFSMGSFYQASQINGPMFPAIADAFYKNDPNLIQAYWLTAMKWYFLWLFYSLGFFIGWGDLNISVFSGDSWLIAGKIIMWISPAIFIKLLNEFLLNILNAINKPKLVFLGTILKVPILLIGGFFFFSNIIKMSMVFTCMELVFFIFLFFNVRRLLHIHIPIWIYAIPGISALISFLTMKLLFFFWIIPIKVIQLAVIYMLYSGLFFMLFIWLGGVEIRDFEMIENGLKMVFVKGNLAHKIIDIIRRVAMISKFYGRFKTENIKNEIG